MVLMSCSRWWSNYCVKLFKIMVHTVLKKVSFLYPVFTRGDQKLDSRVATKVKKIIVMEPAIKTEIKGLSFEEQNEFLHELIMANQKRITTLEQNHNVLFRGIAPLNNSFKEFKKETNENFKGVNSRLDNLEKEIKGMREDLNKFFTESEHWIRETLTDKIKQNIREQIKEHAENCPKQ